MIYTLLVILAVLVSILMIFIVIIQESKGGGLVSNFSSSNSIMGVRKTNDFLEKTTWGTLIVLVVICVVCAYYIPGSATDQSVLEQNATETQTTNPNTTPGFGASQQAPANGAAKTAPAAPKAPKSLAQ